MDVDLSRPSEQGRLQGVGCIGYSSVADTREKTHLRGMHGLARKGVN